MSVGLEHKPEVFESVNYFDKRRLTNAAKRWIFFALDVIDPERKSQLTWLRAGGEESACPCLQKYGRGFIPRGLPALLEMGGEPIPMRHLGDLQSVAWQGLPESEHATRHNFGYVPVYPGDGLRLLQKYSTNEGGKGIGELTALQGTEWDEAHNGGEGILDVIELAQFGDGMPPTLRELEDRIRHAKVNDSRIDYGKLRDEELHLCEMSRNWAKRKISIEHGLLKIGHVGEWQGGWSYSYSPVVEMLIEQLELKRQDQPIQEMATMVSQILANQPAQPAPVATLSAADMELFNRSMDERLAKAQEANLKRIAELEAQLADVPRETFTCDGCGRECASMAGKAAHERHCEAMKLEE